MTFRRIFFVSQNRKALHVNPSVLCFRKFLVAEKYVDRRGGSFKSLRRKLFVSQCRQIS